jgi:MFS family permease
MLEASSRQGRLPVFLALSLTTGLAVGVMSITIPFYALSLSATPADVGLIRAASGIGSLLVVIPAGFVVDRIGARWAYHLGSLADMICVLSFRLVSNPGQLAALGFIDSGFRSLGFNAVTAIFYNALPRFGAKRVGWHKGALSIGLSFLGPVLAGTLLGGGSFDVVFATVIGLMVLANLLMTQIDTPPPRPRQAERLTAGAARGVSELWSLARQPYVALCLATETLVTATFTAFSTFIIVLAVQDLHLNSATASLLSGSEGATFIVAVFFAGALVQRLSPRGTLLAGATAAGGSLIGFAVTAFVPLLFSFALTLGFGLGLLNLVTTTCAGTLVGGKGRAVSLFMASASLGGASGPAMAGILAGWLGIQAAFLVFVPLYGLLAAAMLWRTRLPRSEDIGRRSVSSVLVEEV